MRVGVVPCLVIAELFITECVGISKGDELIDIESYVFPVSGLTKNVLVKKGALVVNEGGLMTKD